jgi:hypothetical protein
MSATETIRVPVQHIVVAEHHYALSLSEGVTPEDLQEISRALAKARENVLDDLAKSLKGLVTPTTPLSAKNDMPPLPLGSLQHLDKDVDLSSDLFEQAEAAGAGNKSKKSKRWRKLK